MWDLSGPGIEPVSPALVGGFLTTVPPGKSEIIILREVTQTEKDKYHIVMEHKLTLLAARQANKLETRCRGKEYDCIWKASRLRGRHTKVSK